MESTVGLRGERNWGERTTVRLIDVCNVTITDLSFACESIITQCLSEVLSVYLGITCKHIFGETEKPHMSKE